VITAKLIRDWRLPGIFEYGYIAVDPLDPNILYGDWLTRTKQDIGEYAKIRRSRSAAASIATRVRCPSFFTPGTAQPVLRCERSVQNDRCGKQLAGD